MSKKPTVELKLPILKNMELVATQTAEVVSKHMDLSEEKSAEISMAVMSLLGEDSRIWHVLPPGAAQASSARCPGLISNIIVAS